VVLCYVGVEVVECSPSLRTDELFGAADEPLQVLSFIRYGNVFQFFSLSPLSFVVAPFTILVRLSIGNVAQQISVGVTTGPECSTL